MQLRASVSERRAAYTRRVALAFTTGPSFTAAESNRNRGISNCNVIRGRSERGRATGEAAGGGGVGGGPSEGRRERENEAAGRRIKNAGSKGSRGFHLTE